jgi:hypothetical protein
VEPALAYFFGHSISTECSRESHTKDLATTAYPSWHVKDSWLVSTLLPHIDIRSIANSKKNHAPANTPAIMRQMKIFSGSSHPTLADAVCERLGQDVASAELGKFANGETKVQLSMSSEDCRARSYS